MGRHEVVSIPFIQAGLHLPIGNGREVLTIQTSQSPLSKRVFIYTSVRSSLIISFLSVSIPFIQAGLHLLVAVQDFVDAGSAEVSIPFIQAGLHLPDNQDDDFADDCDGLNPLYPSGSSSTEYTTRRVVEAYFKESQSPLSKRVFIYHFNCLYILPLKRTCLNPLYPSGSSSTSSSTAF